MQDLNKGVFVVANNTQENNSANVLPNNLGIGKGKRKRGIVISIIIIFIMVIGAVIGIYLVQKSKEIKAPSASDYVADCGQSVYCTKIDPAPNSSSYTSSCEVDHVYVKAGIHYYIFPNDNNDCYRVDINGRLVTWTTLRPGPICEDVSHVEVWCNTAGFLPTPTLQPTLTPVPAITIAPGFPSATPTQNPTATPIVPTITLTPTNVPEFIASCNGLFTYDTDWNLLSSQDLSNLKVGDTIRFATSATVNQGYVSMAKFIINNVEQPETTLVRSGTELFYYDYIIPEAVTEFSVRATLYHSTQGWF